MWAEGGLTQKGGHELVRVDLVDATLHGTPPLLGGEATLRLLELADGLALLLLGGPLELDLDVQRAIGL